MFACIKADPDSSTWVCKSCLLKKEREEELSKKLSIEEEFVENAGEIQTNCKS